jgi:hypothetical protein
LVAYNKYNTAIEKIKFFLDFFVISGYDFYCSENKNQKESKMQVRTISFLISLALFLGCEYDSTLAGTMTGEPNFVETQTPMPAPAVAVVHHTNNVWTQQWTCVCRGGTFPDALTYHGIIVCTTSTTTFDSVYQFALDECHRIRGDEMTLDPNDCVFVDLETPEDCSAFYEVE